MPRSRSPTWQPKPEDYLQVFADQNPWHASGIVSPELAPEVERPLARELWQRITRDEPRRYQLVLGPRRVGKTTAMHQTVRRLLASGVPARRLWWLRLDHPLLIPIPLGDLVREHVLEGAHATSKSPLYLFFDELAYARDWDLWLKTFYDERWPVRIVATSSSTAALKDRRMESGAGRWEEQYLAPYLFTEFLELVGHPVDLAVGSSLDETLRSAVLDPPDLGGITGLRTSFMQIGGFPEPLIPLEDKKLDEARWLVQAQRILRSDAIERAIYKDIPQAFGVDRPMLLERLLYLLAGQVAGLFSAATIARQLGGMAQPTLERYLSYLERAFLVFTLPNYSGSEKAIQKRGRKLYFVDGAVRNAALQRGIAPFADASETGMLLENLVAGHLHALGQQSQVRLFHWRHGDDEVDLVLNHPEKPLAFEVSSSASHSQHGLNALVSAHPRFRGKCWLVAPRVTPTLPEKSADSIGRVPLDLLLLAVGRQAERELSLRLSG